MPRPMPKGYNPKASPEELAAQWEKRAQKILASTPRTFKTAAAYVRTQSATICREKTSAMPPTNQYWFPAILYRGEAVRHTGPGTAEIFNATTSVWHGVRYKLATILHEGRESLKTPTRWGRKHYLWMFNRNVARPEAKSDSRKDIHAVWMQWLRLIKAGKAGVAKSLPAEPGQPFRDEAIQKSRAKVANLIRVDAVHSAFKQTGAKQSG